MTDPLRPDPIMQAWQERLQAVAKAESKPDPLPIYGADGFGGHETQAAIRAFQSSRLPRPLPASGQFDDATRAALSQHPQLPPVSISPIELGLAKAAVGLALPPSPAKDFIMLNFATIAQTLVGLLPGIPDDYNTVVAEISEQVSGDPEVAKVRSAAIFARRFADALDQVADTIDPGRTIQPSVPLPPSYTPTLKPAG